MCERVGCAQVLVRASHADGCWVLVSGMGYGAGMVYVICQRHVCGLGHAMSSMGACGLKLSTLAATPLLTPSATSSTLLCDCYVIAM